MANQLEHLAESIKSKVKLFNSKKSAYVTVEIGGRKARQLIDKTLKVADHPGKRSVPS